MVDVLPTIATDFGASAFLISGQPVKKPTKEGQKTQRAALQAAIYRHFGINY